MKKLILVPIGFLALIAFATQSYETSKWISVEGWQSAMWGLASFGVGADVGVETLQEVWNSEAPGTGAEQAEAEAEARRRAAEAEASRQAAAEEAARAAADDGATPVAP